MAHDGLVSSIQELVRVVTSLSDKVSTLEGKVAEQNAAVVKQAEEISQLRTQLECTSAAGDKTTKQVSTAAKEGETKSAINYGVGMACSYFEGYLMHIIPSDGASFVGFEENIRALEDYQGVLFPVKKLFIIITKSLYSPPDLKELNKGMDGPYLEAFNQLTDVIKNVAGVRNRTYRNTAYKIYRPGAAPAPPAPPVCLTAECATPLHTLHRVINNRALYNEVADIDVSSVVSDFCSTLRSIIDKSPQCRGKCELVYYDHDDPTQNLAEILLKRIRELVPDFEQRIIQRRNENVLEN